VWLSPNHLVSSLNRHPELAKDLFRSSARKEIFAVAQDYERAHVLGAGLHQSSPRRSSVDNATYRIACDWSFRSCRRGATVQTIGLWSRGETRRGEDGMFRRRATYRRPALGLSLSTDHRAARNDAAALGVHVDSPSPPCGKRNSTRCVLPPVPGQRLVPQEPALEWRELPRRFRGRRTTRPVRRRPSGAWAPAVGAGPFIPACRAAPFDRRTGGVLEFASLPPRPRSPVRPSRTAATNQEPARRARKEPRPAPTGRPKPASSRSASAGAGPAAARRSLHATPGRTRHSRSNSPLLHCRVIGRGSCPGPRSLYAMRLIHRTSP